MIRKGLAVLIPSYDRPEVLDKTLGSWLKSNLVDKVLLVVEASSEEVLERYQRVLEKYNKGRIIYKLSLGRLGSVEARNVLLDMASRQAFKYVVMADDDYILPHESSLLRMSKWLDHLNDVGAVGGRIIIAGWREDPDFFLNLPFNLADTISRLLGYVFLDVEHGPRISEFLPPFFMIRGEVIDKGVRYDEHFNTPTGFREESDFQQQIKRMKYRLLLDPNSYVIHLAIQSGGNRPKMSMGERIYWKIRNHVIFICKWNTSTLKRVWYMLLATLILLLYRPWHIFWILRGLRDGLYALSKNPR
ncbi:MAG: glycosyltransferase [Candidatus Nezhaarchaeales archaeon]